MRARMIVSTGARLDFEDVDEVLTVLELKQRVANAVAGLAAEQQRAIYRGRVLLDESTLAEISFRDGDSIHIVRGPATEQIAAASTVPTTSSAHSPFASVPGMDSDSMKMALNNPLVQQIMSNPETLRAIIFSNPQMRELVEQNPEIGHILSDPNVLRQTVETARNPELMREMMRSSDRAMSNLESHPEGFNALRRMYNTIQEPLNQIGPGGKPPSHDGGGDSIARSQQSETLNTAALPNPWAAQAPAHQQRPPAVRPMLHGLGGLGLGAGGGGGGALPAARPPAPQALPKPGGSAVGGAAGGSEAGPGAAGLGAAGPGGASGALATAPPPGSSVLGALSASPMQHSPMQNSPMQNSPMQHMLEAMQDPMMQQLLSATFGAADPSIAPPSASHPGLLPGASDPSRWGGGGDATGAEPQQQQQQQQALLQMLMQPHFQAQHDSAAAGRFGQLLAALGGDPSQAQFQAAALQPMGAGGPQAPPQLGVLTEDGRRAAEARYESELAVISDMGFDDRAKVLEALIATGGNINAAIARLIG